MGDTRVLRNTFWRDLGPGSFALFLGAVFFTFASLGFLVDILALGRPSLGELAYVTVVTGLVSVSYAWCGTRARRWLPLAVAGQIVLLSLTSTLFPRSADAPDLERIRSRLVLDVTGAIAFTTIGYVLFIVLISREGVAAVKLRTEIALAREIHQSLVPPVMTRAGAFEVCGVSIPSGAVGGDLVDLVEDAGGWLGYVADVSGHGVPAGLLTGMVKSAMRARLLSPQSLAALLEDLNRIVLDVKRTNMFVTLAAVRSSGAGVLEMTLAGHLPILRIRSGDRSVEELSIAQIPLGILESPAFASLSFECGPGDLLALVTDGLCDVFDRRDREFGLAGVKAVLSELSDRPLTEIRDGLLARAAAHGPQIDDQTVLLIRHG
jgi:hypothetical protein